MSYGSWKVLEFYSAIFQELEVLEINAGPGKSWKFSAVLFLDFYFVRVFCFNYCAFGRPGVNLMKHFQV